MGCNCGKPTPGPQGQPPQTGNGPTGNSGGLSGQTQSFSLQLPDGRSRAFSGSLLEAQAAAVRSGATIRPI
jgi:hypothetical protein